MKKITFPLEKPLYKEKLDFKSIWQSSALEYNHKLITSEFLVNAVILKASSLKTSVEIVKLP